MKARVKTFLNIRTEKPEILANNNPGDKFYSPGDVIEVVEAVEGDKYKDNNIWYKLDDGTFVWSGGVAEVTAPPALLAAETKRSFQWFKDLKIEEIWDQFNERGENVTVAILDTGYNIANDDLSPAVIGVNVIDGSPPIQMDDIK